MSEPLLPEGAFLISCYSDPRRGIETRHVYYGDGRVMAYDGEMWWVCARFTPEQVTRVQELLRASGLLTAQDLRVADTHDTAQMIWAWALTESKGQVTNWAYPAQKHPAQETLSDALDELEAHAAHKNNG